MHFVPSLVKVKERCLGRLFNVWETKGSNIVADLARKLWMQNKSYDAKTASASRGEHLIFRVVLVSKIKIQII